MYLQKPQTQPGPEGVTLPADGYPGVESGGAGLPRTISMNGRCISFSEFGAAAGYPVLYCHQYGGSRLEARALDAMARRRGFRIVAADRPGLGGSDYASTGISTGAGTAQADPAVDLAALADTLGLQSYGVLAWGGGAGYALELAQRRPERVRFCLALSCPSLFLDPDGMGGAGGGKRWMWTVLQHTLQWRCRLGARWTPTARRLALLDRIAGSSDRRLLRQAGVQRWLRATLDEAARQGSRGLAQDVAGSFRHCRFDPQQLDLPVEFWYGASDRLVNDCGGRWLVARMPRGRLRRLCGAGHFFFLRHQDMLFDRLTALADQGGSSRWAAGARDVPASPASDSRALVA